MNLNNKKTKNIKPKRRLFLMAAIALLVSCSNEGTKTNEEPLLQVTPPVLSNTVRIGTQVWMTRNLNVSRYSDGTIIPEVNEQSQWVNLTTGAWCYFASNTANGTIYGKLYNWYAVAGIYDAASAANPALRKKLAPDGSHVPSDAEWTTLTSFLGGESVAGGKMKATGTSLWLSPNTEATNSSGFTGLPGGFRGSLGNFFSIGTSGYWWSSTEAGTTFSWCRRLNYSASASFSYDVNRNYGMAVRCVRD